MSQLIRSAKGTVVTSTLQRTAIMHEPLKSTWQTDAPNWVGGTTASPSSISPGGSTSINIKINPRGWEQEEAHYITYDVLNNSAVQTATFKRGPLTHWESISLTISNSRDKIEVLSMDQLIELYSEFALTRGLSIYEDLFFMRNEFDTFNGITITNGTAQTFFLSLAPIIDFAKTCLRNPDDTKSIQDIKIDLKAHTAPSNAKEAALICLSSAVTAAYTKDNITFSNIRFIRQYTTINDSRLIVWALLSDVPIRHTHFKVEAKTVRTGTWNLGDSVNFKLSDILKRNMIQYIVPVCKKNASAYNDADSQKEFSGYNYFGYKHRQLFGDKLVVDMTDARLLRAREFQKYYNEFGRKQLPSAIWKNSDDFNKFYLRMGRINFDNVIIENAHELVRETDSVNEDYDITLYANANVGSDCDVVVIMVYCEEFQFNGNQMVKLN